MAEDDAVELLIPEGVVILVLVLDDVCACKVEDPDDVPDVAVALGEL